MTPVEVVTRFIECINRGDLDGLTALMTDDHTLAILDEAPLVGRDANADAWHGYFTAFPDYVIHPRHIAVKGDTVAILGTTTGSHLGLPDDEEMQLEVLWIAATNHEKVARWSIVDDTPDARAEWSFPR